MVKVIVDYGIYYIKSVLSFYKLNAPLEIEKEKKENYYKLYKICI